MLTDEQRERLLQAVHRRFNLLGNRTFDSLKTEQECDALVRQIRAAVAANHRSGLLERFGGNYGLARGLAAAVFVLFFVALGAGAFQGWRSWNTWLTVIIFLVTFAAALRRMWESHYFHAVELFVEFLNLPPRAEGHNTGPDKCQ